MSVSFVARRRSVWAAVAALVLTNGCGNKGNITVSSVNSVTVTPNPASVLVGATTPLSVSVSVTGGAAQTVTWSSSNTAVATISSSGSTATVTGVSAGSATITATSTVDASKSGTAVVTVSVPQALVANPTSLSFTATQGGTIPAAKTVTLTANFGSITGILGTFNTVTGGNWLSLAVAGSTPSTNTVSIVTTNLTPGTYTGSVTFGGSAGANLTVPVTYIVTASVAQVCTPTTANSTLVTLGSRTVGALAASDCKDGGNFFNDNYRVVMATAGTIQVDMVRASPTVASAFNPFVFLFDANGNFLQGDNDGGFDTDAQLTRAVPAGTYFIQASTLNINEVGNYELYVGTSGGAGTVCAIGNANTSALNFPGSIAGTLATSDCVAPEGGVFFADFYRFVRTTTNTITVTMTSTSGTAIDPYLYLLDVNGNNIAQDDDSGGGLAARISQVLAPGTYFIAASSVLQNQVGGYTLSSTAAASGAAIQMERVTLPVDRLGRPMVKPGAKRR